MSKQARHELGRRPRRTYVIALMVAMIFGWLGCDARAREIRAGLSDADLQLFVRGQQLSSPCWSCHDFYGSQNKIGPYLSGLYGRRAGSAAFPGYSRTMRYSTLIWNDKNLRRFLSNVQGVMPGTSMVSADVGSAQDLEALIFYTKLVTTPVD